MTTTAQKTKTPATTTRRGPKKSSPGTKGRKTKSQQTYLQQSQVFRAEMEKRRDNALSAIEAIENDMLSIETQANNEIQHIRQIADAEIEARRRQHDDLAALLRMTSAALGLNEELEANNTRLALALNEQAESQDASVETSDSTGS